MRRLPFHPALEGLRGIAVLVVMLFHAGVPGAGGGFLGVSTFFTLSGFLITRLLTAEREQQGRIGLRAFWARRLRRLMPAALLGLAAIALLGTLYGDYGQQERLGGDGLAGLLYVANWWLIVSGAAYADLMGSPSFIQHLWSLAIEEQYYAVFPVIAAVLLARAGRRPLAIFLALGTLASWAWMFALGDSDATTARIYYGTDTRSGELLVGGLLAIVVGRPIGHSASWLLAPLGVLGLMVSACLWSVATVESPWLYQGGLAGYAIASSALVLGCIAPSGPVRRLLSTQPLRWIGRVSYGAYVYHWPIFLVVDDRTGLDSLAILALRVVLTFGVAGASYRWLEEPILNGRLLVGWRAAVVAATVFLAVGLSFHQVGSNATGPPKPGTRDATAGLVDGAPRVAILGDSVGRDVGNGLTDWASRTGEAEILNLATRGCGLAVGAWPAGSGRRATVCDRWRTRVREQLTRFEPDVVVVMSAMWELAEREKPEWGGPRALGDPLFDTWLSEEFESTLHFLDDFDAHVVWLTAPCIIAWIEGHEEGIFDPARLRHLNEAILPAVAEGRPATDVIDLFGAVCPAGHYAGRLFGIEPFRTDGIHFSKRGQRWVGAWLGPQVVEVLGDARAQPSRN